MRREWADGWLGRQAQRKGRHISWLLPGVPRAKGGACVPGQERAAPPRKKRQREWLHSDRHTQGRKSSWLLLAATHTTRGRFLVAAVCCATWLLPWVALKKEQPPRLLLGTK